MSRQRAFTLIELLVVVAIIVALLAILLPSLGKAVEVANRAVCGSNLHQISIAAISYAADHDRRYPETSSSPANPSYDQLGWIAPKAYLALTVGLKWEDLGTSSAVQSVERTGELHMHCPSRRENWFRQERDNAGLRIGYYTHFGRVQKPVWSGAGFTIATETWRSPLSVTDASSSTVMAADIVEENTLVPPVDSGSHGTGGLVSAAYDGGLDNDAPMVMGVQGTNVLFGDGATRWRSVMEMRPYPTAPLTDNRRGWW